MSDPPPLIPRERFWIKEGDKVCGPLDYIALEDLQSQRLITVNQMFAESEDGPWFHVHEASFLAFLAVEASHWHWLKPGHIADRIEGPITGETLLRQLKQQMISPKMAVSHHIYTQRQWKPILGTQLGEIFTRDKLRRERGM
jgi:hypothetical protein